MKTHVRIVGLITLVLVLVGTGLGSLGPAQARGPQIGRAHV